MHSYTTAIFYLSIKFDPLHSSTVWQEADSDLIQANTRAKITDINTNTILLQKQTYYANVTYKAENIWNASLFLNNI